MYVFHVNMLLLLFDMQHPAHPVSALMLTPAFRDKWSVDVV